MPKRAPVAQNNLQHNVTALMAQAQASLSPAERIRVSPQVLRHTFLRKLAEEKGVQYAKEASGYKSDRYIWRYVKPSQESLAAAIAALE